MGSKYGNKYPQITPPSQVCRFLGLEIDSNELEVRLPLDKLEKLKGLLAKYVDWEKGVGKFRRTIVPLYPLCRRGKSIHLYKVILKHNLKYIRLGRMAREDLKWWSYFWKVLMGKEK